MMMMMMMMNMASSFLVAASVLFSASVVVVTADWTTTTTKTSGSRNMQRDETYCGINEEMAVWDLLLDSTPEDTGWKLVCDDEDDEDDDEEERVVWDMPVGLLSPATMKNTWVNNKACIPTDSTCTFTIYDQSGDGLTDDGWYALTYGATTVAVYSYQGDNEPFSEDEFCFGPACEELPLEQADVFLQDIEDEENGLNGEKGGATGAASTSSGTPDDTSSRKSKILAGVFGAIGIILLLCGVGLLVKCCKDRKRSTYYSSDVGSEKGGGSDTNHSDSENHEVVREKAIYTRNDDMEECLEFGICRC